MENTYFKPFLFLVLSICLFSCKRDFNVEVRLNGQKISATNYEVYVMYGGGTNSQAGPLTSATNSSIKEGGNYIGLDLFIKNAASNKSSYIFENVPTDAFLKNRISIFEITSFKNCSKIYIESNSLLKNDGCNNLILVQ